jgi:uncharacterized membrane protein HdeD (DUF308 family)
MSEAIGQFFPVDAKHWWHVALRGFLALLFGILLFAWPGIGKRSWLFVRGILGIIVGIITLCLPAVTEIALILIIGAWALIAGIMELSFAFTAVKETGAKWLFAISGILAIILGILLLIRPIAGIIAVIWFIGAYAVMAGIVLIILGFRLRGQKA